ncbi:MAG: M67 family metallopeptidase [Mariprofundales bacterium]|nr:M67 family metallopeptidase [Mariprofundales bacterium]
MQTPTPDRFNSAAYRSVLSPDPVPNCALIADGVLSTITQAGCAGYPYEVCGLLIGSTTPSGDWSISEARQVDNVSRERVADRFLLDPVGYKQIDSELRSSSLDIIGVFHSHPDCPARPSPTDCEAAWEGLLYPIVSICQGESAETLWWTLSSDGKQFHQVVAKICA